MATFKSTPALVAAFALAALASVSAASELPSWPTAGAGRGFAQVPVDSSKPWPSAGAGRGMAQIPQGDIAKVAALPTWPTAGAGRGMAS